MRRPAILPGPFVGLGTALGLALGVAACNRSPAEPACEAIVRDPARGLERVTSYTSDPVRVWSILEACFAPRGDTCERAAVGGAMAPSMTISDGSSGDAARREDGWRQWAERCRSLPAEQQQCLVLSYQLGHPECAKIADELRAKLP